MFSKIYSILVDFLGESKQGCYSKGIEQYQFNCPCCTEENYGEPDGKYNLEVNLGIGKYQCWKCNEIHGTKGNISKLIKKYGGHKLYKKYKEEIGELYKSKSYDINLYSGITSFDDSDVETVYLPKTYTKIRIGLNTSPELEDFLKKRKIDQNIINKFRIGMTSDKESDVSMRNRIIIPSYDEFDDLNYWVGRDFSGKQHLKYKSCSSDKRNIVFNESLIDWDNDIILVEGAIDCLYFPNSISLLGKTLSRSSYTYSSIIEKANANVIICLDNDTTIEETKKIYNILNCGRLKNKIFYIRLNKIKDFGELYEKYGKNGIITALRSATKFNEIDLII